tara:strand:- start:3821 stop:4294 length:474 start_codon:yes stop_codon:yes gene_type:complete
MTYKNKNKKNKGGNNISTILQNITNIIVLAVIFISLYFIIQFINKINTTNETIQENFNSLREEPTLSYVVSNPVITEYFSEVPLPPPTTDAYKENEWLRKEGAGRTTTFLASIKREFENWWREWIEYRGREGSSAFMGGVPMNLRASTKQVWRGYYK